MDRPIRRSFDLQLFALLSGPEAEAARVQLLQQGFEERTVTQGDSEVTLTVPTTAAGAISQIFRYKVPPTRRAALLRGQVARLVFKDGASVDMLDGTTLIFAARQDPSKTYDGKIIEMPYTNWKGQTLGDQQNALRFQQQALFFTTSTGFISFGPQTFFEIYQKGNTTTLANTNNFTVILELFLAPA